MMDRLDLSIRALVESGELDEHYAARLWMAAQTHQHCDAWRAAAACKLLHDAIAGDLDAETAYCLAHCLLAEPAA